MKKFLGLFLAVVFVAEGVAPAIATEVTVGGEMRLRYENTENGDWTDATSDRKAETTQRTRLNAKFSVDDQTTAYISIFDARTHGEDVTASDNMDVGIDKAYLQIKNVIGPIEAKIGRQALSYGNQRILGAFEWSNTGRRFDGLKFGYSSEVATVDFFYTDVVSNGAGVRDGNVKGLYAQLKVIPANTLDLYYFFDTDPTPGTAAQAATPGAVNPDGSLTLPTAAIDAVPGGKNIDTLGLRLAGKAGGADWTLEYAIQGGDQSTGVKKDGSLMAITAGYTIPGVLGGLRIGGEFFDASGDDASDKNTSWTSAYATNHFHYGILDSEGNGTDVKGFAIKLKAKPVKGIQLGLEYWALEESETAAGASAWEIEEINFQLKHKISEKVKGYFYIAQGDPTNRSTADDAKVKIGYQVAAKF